MEGKCQQCGRQELLPGKVRVYCHTVAALGSPVQVERPHVCPNCGREIRAEMSYVTGRPSRVAGAAGPEHGQGRRVESLHAMIHGNNAARSATVQYAGVCLSDSREVLPKHEGTIQDGTMVDQYGDPELMASFAEHYLAAHRAVMPSGRLPESVVEMMPALHLVVMAVELAMKGDLMRSGIEPGNVHALERLYEELEPAHRKEADDRFSRCGPNARLASVGEGTPSVEAVLRVYDQSYGGASKVYLDTRYYAEPTTKFGTSTGLHGASLVKGNTPYPIFLPHLAESLIETFRFFDGAARLERLGADVSAGTRADVKNNHGSWGLVPASLGLVALQVPQGARLGTGQTELPAYERWKRQRHAGYSTSWMYGGSELLFYRADGNTPGEAVTNIDGLDCRIWRDARLGMHSRDLYGLADTIEAGGVTETVEA